MPRFKSPDFFNVDVDMNDDEDVTVRTNAKSRAEFNQRQEVYRELTTTTRMPNSHKLQTSGGR